jgi:hypothetical protein
MPTSCRPTSYTLYPAPSSTQSHLPTPIPPLPPPHPSLARATSPVSNQRGHVTTLKHAQDARRLARTDYNNSAPSDTQAHLPTTISSLPPPPSSPPRAISLTVNQPGHVTASNYTQYASAFNDDERELAPVNNVQPRCESHTTYPLRTWPNIPPAPSATVDYNGMPQYILRSRPLGLQPKRRRYERRCIPPIPRTCDIRHTSHSLAFASHSDIDNPLAAARVPAIPFVTGKLDCGSSTHQSDQHQRGNNNGTAPYPTIRSRPPPWPIKTFPTALTANLRPPPWPNKCSETSPILSTANFHPPPWPIIPHYFNQIIQNRRNAKRRFKVKSRRISDKVFV